MPRTGLILAAILAASSFAPAQPQPGGARIPVPGSGVPGGATPGGLPPAAPPVDPALRAHLLGWEKVMHGAANFYTECTLVRKNLLRRNELTFTGSIMCLKPNMARMRLEQKPTAGQKPDPNAYQAYICTGQAVYEYEGLSKTVTKFPLEKGIGENLLLEFISGSLKADDVIRRFDLKLLKLEKQQEKYYIILEIRPREARDKVEFEVMTLVLFQPSVPKLGYLPRTVRIRKNNGQDEEVWDFPEPRVNLPPDQIKREYFQFVSPGKDWKVQQAQPQPSRPGRAPGAATSQPRVVRPSTPR
jgi:TIGR03009 family protein